jgi:hypothetical protein
MEDEVLRLARRVELLEGIMEGCLKNYSTTMPRTVKRLLEGALKGNREEESEEANSERFKALKGDPYLLEVKAWIKRKDDEQKKM